MKMIKYRHACLRLENDGVLVIDPGMFSERSALDGVDAVLITHEHADHLDLDALAEALAARPSVEVYAHPEVLPRLAPLDGVTHPVTPGQSFTAAGFAVRAYGGRHAQIHPDIPSVANLGFLVEGKLYHPGDSFDLPHDVQVDTAFVPISAPWLKASESVEFLRRLRPRRAYALHDCLLNEAGLKLSDSLMTRLSGCEYSRLDSGTMLDC